MNESKIVHETKEGLLKSSGDAKHPLKKIVGSAQTKKEQRKEIIILTGITTSQVNQAPKAKNPYPARVFLKAEGQGQDIPIFFRIKDPIKSKFRDFLDPNFIGTYEMEINQCPFCQGTLETKYYRKWCWNEKCLEEFRLFEKSGGWIKSKIKTGSYLEVKGYFDNPKNGSPRKSFTAYSYRLQSAPHSRAKEVYERAWAHFSRWQQKVKDFGAEIMNKREELEKVRNHDQ